MPTISMFYGILIRMFADDHNPPHIHAVYGDEKAIFDLEGNLREGSLPPKKVRMVQTWIDIHEEDLKANWKLAQEGEDLFKIDPLK